MFNRDLERQLVRRVPPLRLRLTPSGPTILRREDLLYLNFRFINLRIVKGQTRIPQLRRINPDREAFIIISLQPQSIAEEAFIEEAIPSDPPPPPVRARMAGPSRLVFTLPEGVNHIPYTIESLLDWTQFEPSLAANALPPNPPLGFANRPRPQQPTATQTAIEFPYRMMLSPNHTAGWAHALQPITYAGRTELWHTRLGVLAEGIIDEEDASTRTMRAIWSPDYNSTGDPPLPEGLDPGAFRTTLKPNWRHQIVRLSSDFGIWTGRFVRPGGVITPSFELSDISFIEDITPVIPPSLRDTHIAPEGPITRRTLRLPDDAITEPAQIDSELVNRIRRNGDNPPIISPTLMDDLIAGNLEIDRGILDDLLPILQYYDPEPIDVEQFMLTSQGTAAKLHGQWDVEEIPTSLGLGLDVTDWRHVATQGRDHYVRVVQLGYIYPFGHKAVKITITERKFEAPNGGNVGAYLRQRSFIVIKERDKTYRANSFEHNGRENPFRQLIRFKTLITPKLDAIASDEYIGVNDSGAHWIEVGNKPFIFHLQARDVEGQLIDFHAGGIFVPHGILGTGLESPVFSALSAIYTSHPIHGATARRVKVPNQRVAYAERNPNKDGNTLLDTEGLYFLAREANGEARFPFVPFMDVAEVRIPSADAIAGGQGMQTIKLFQEYLDNPQGLLDEAANAGGVFAELVAKKAITFAAEQAGGLTTPNINMSGLSQDLGPVAGTLSDIASGSFDPVDFFNGVSAKLLGGIDLFDIIQAAAGAGFSDQLPKLNVKPIPEPPAIPQRIEATMQWQPAVKPFGPFEPTGATQLTIDVLLTQYLDNPATPPSSKIEGELTAFDINFADVITITFNQLRFIKEDNKKLDVHVDIPPDGIVFGGPLKFLNELEKYLDPASFIDPPVLDISPSGVTVGYTLQLPPLAIGVFTLKDVGLGAALSLPFGGGVEDRMRVRFNLSERQAPFNLSIMIFGGGGFFAISLGADGLEVLEIALEFGGSFAFDIGVASGGASAMAGFYFMLATSPYRIELTAYLRINGHLSVLGIISISVEFYLELSYKEFPGGKSKLTGRATVTVKVEVLFFSASVKLTVERKFSGNADDPTFSEMLEPGDWFEYGEAFA
ncbi:hypothetical protein G4Y79_03030 [Phototrophicus methaneseepsis]|uniref:Uncharacterized protein n=1 Tax=Phototrophicus methaneseepsis TaxID=2710758 RepID=A0A7S8IFC9_9CHLR|nr:hypothetical protein [Phototrophicus methaneseepsis]QPC83369.1 hypothetical protein G4Y79_03030 [Phototrophicus methaneseepsis]